MAIALGGVEEQRNLRGGAGFRVRRLGDDAPLQDGSAGELAFGVLPLQRDPGKDGVADLDAAGIDRADQVGLHGLRWRMILSAGVNRAQQDRASQQRLNFENTFTHSTNQFPGTLA